MQIFKLQITFSNFEKHDQINFDSGAALIKHSTNTHTYTHTHTHTHTHTQTNKVAKGTLHATRFFFRLTSSI